MEQLGVEAANLYSIYIVEKEDTICGMRFEGEVVFLSGTDRKKAII